jgi:hypothetical protein
MGQSQSQCRGQHVAVAAPAEPEELTWEQPYSAGLQREVASLADKEAAAEMTFMVDSSNAKRRAAADPAHLANVLRREDNSAHEYAYAELPVRLPTDAEGFVQAFGAGDDPSAIRAFFEEFGVVVVEGVLVADDCERSRAELWGAWCMHACMHALPVHDFLRPRVPFTQIFWSAKSRA